MVCWMARADDRDRWDTTGFMIEHYADGDLVNQDTPIGWMNAGDESLAVWGPEVRTLPGERSGVDPPLLALPPIDLLRGLLTVRSPRRSRSGSSNK